jgi:hypothetical protein
MHLYKLSSEEAWTTLGDNLKIERPDSAKPSRPPIDTGIVVKYHNDLLSSSTNILQILHERRGLTDEAIAKYQIGWDGERVTIPIYNEFNDLVNIRRYKWDAPTAAEKFLNYTDEFGNSYGELRLFGIEHLQDPDCKTLLYCEGELDRIILEQYGFDAITPTSGTGSFRPEWIKMFKGKELIIVQDNDEAGQNGANIIAEQLYRVANVKLLYWPPTFMEKGDPTDWFTGGGSLEEFKELVAGAQPYKQEEIVVDDTVMDVRLNEASHFEHMGKRQRIKIMVSGKDTAPYVAPKKVHITCVPKEKGCEGCGVCLNGGDSTIEFTSATQATMNLIQCTNYQQELAIKDAAHIPVKCGRCTFDIQEYMNIEEIRAIPQAENEYTLAKDSEYVVRKCYYIGKDIKTNQRYAMVGYPHAEPKTQYVTHIFDDAIPAQDRVDSFNMTPELFEQLKIFQPSEGQSIEDKFDEVHRDFERNVTYVWERRNVGIAVDLIYHTTLSFYFQEQFIKKGWAELLIIGDSGQAKSTLVERMMKHYKMGDFYSGESSKRTGLVYSFQQMQKRWFLTWGAWPLNDGGLVVIDEFSGISEEELANMSDVRSSGIARATGVITAETNARTRAIFMGNPRNGRQLSTETYGVQAVLKLFGKAEDVRRLDLVVGVASGDIDSALINRSINTFTAVPHKYTSDLCRNRVLWCWSRKPDDVVFEEDAQQAILDGATAMGKKYSSQIPIVEPADQRLKIARLSISCAGAMFSSPDGKRLVVKKEHVDFVLNFLNATYDAPNLDYKGYSETSYLATDVEDAKLLELRRKFVLLPVMNHNELAQALHNLNYFRRFDLQDATGLNTEDVLKLMAFLSLNKIVENSMSGYRKLPAGIKLVKDIIERPITQDEINGVRREMYKSAEY